MPRHYPVVLRQLRITHNIGVIITRVICSVIRLLPTLALCYTVPGMVSDFLAKSYGGLSYEGIYLYVNSRVEKTKIIKSRRITL